jgi:hypothetical protein
MSFINEKTVCTSATYNESINAATKTLGFHGEVSGGEESGSSKLNFQISIKSSYYCFGNVFIRSGFPFIHCTFPAKHTSRYYRLTPQLNSRAARRTLTTRQIAPSLKGQKPFTNRHRQLSGKIFSGTQALHRQQF